MKKGEIEGRARDERENNSTGGGWRREGEREVRDLFKKKYDDKRKIEA